MLRSSEENRSDCRLQRGLYADLIAWVAGELRAHPGNDVSSQSAARAGSCSVPVAEEAARRCC